MKHSPRLQPEQKQEFISLREELGDTIKAVEEMWKIHPELKVVLSKPQAHDIWYKHKTGKLVLPKLSESQAQEELHITNATPTRIEPVQTFDVEVPGSSPDVLTREERKELRERALEMRKKGLKWTVVHATLAKQYKGKKIPKLGSLMQFPSQERYKERQQQEPTPTMVSDVASPEIELPKRKNYMVLVATPSVTLTFEVTKEKLNNIISTVMED